MAKTILIADDNGIFRRALCEVFTRDFDFEVCGEAKDGQDAVEKAQRLHPDLIVLDLSIPVMNGLEAARALKSQMPSVPIIMFSLYVDAFLKGRSALRWCSRRSLKIRTHFCANGQSAWSSRPQGCIIMSFPNRENPAHPSLERGELLARLR